MFDRRLRELQQEIATVQREAESNTTVEVTALAETIKRLERKVNNTLGSVDDVYRPRLDDLNRRIRSVEEAIERRASAEMESPQASADYAPTRHCNRLREPA